MKTLVGKIYRDEHGVETIEREPTEYRVEWQITRISPVRDFHSRFKIECPHCHHVEFRSFLSKDMDLNEHMKTYGSEGEIYCGHCGKKNLFEIF